MREQFLHYVRFNFTSYSFVNRYAWCQPEPYVENVTNYLVGVSNFTVFVRVTIKYPKVSFTVLQKLIVSVRCDAVSNKLRPLHSNLFSNNANGTQTTPGYNQFTVSQMLGDVQYEDVQQEGCMKRVIICNNCYQGAIGVIITWNCDLDHSTSECQPSFDYIRSVEILSL